MSDLQENCEMIEGSFLNCMQETPERIAGNYNTFCLP